MRFTSILVMLMLPAAAAQADEREIMLSVVSGPTFLHREGRWNVGGGAMLRAAYGLPDIDVVAVELNGGCDYLSSIRGVGDPKLGQDVHVIYDATRCGFVPGVVLRLGARLVGTVGLGLGYRYESHSHQVAVANGSNVLIEQLPKASEHQVVITGRGSVEYRIWDLFSVGADATGLKIIANGPASDLELKIAVTMSVYFY